MEEDNLKNYISMYEEIKRNQDIIDNIDKRFFFEFVDTLLKAYKELEESNEILNKAYWNYCIPVSLVEEKIEELKKCGNDWILQIEIRVLQELLEKRK